MAWKYPALRFGPKIHIHFCDRRAQKKSTFFLLQEQINQTKRDMEIKIQIDISFVLSS